MKQTLMTLLLAIFASMSLSMPVRAHARTDADNLRWSDPAGCAFVYSDKDVFKGVSEGECDFILGSKKGEFAAFNSKVRAAQGEALLYSWKEEAKKALTAFETGKTALLEKTDPVTFPKGHEAKAKKLLQAKAEVEEKGPQLAEPFGKADKYVKDLRGRRDELAKLYDEEKKKLGEEAKERVEKMQAKFETGNAGALKAKGDVFEKGGADEAKLGRELFDGNGKDGGKRGTGGALTGRMAAEGKAAPGQLRDSGAEAAAGQYGKDGKAPPKPPKPDDSLGGAKEQKGMMANALDYGKDLARGFPWIGPAAPEATPKSVSRLQSNIVANPPVSQKAADEANRVMGEMLKGAPPQVAQNMVDNGVHVVIIPKGQKLTDVGDFQQLRGQSTFDGRRWEDVKGVADVPMAGGGVACAVPEENLLSRGKNIDSRGYPPDYTMVHEFGHMVKFYGVPKTASAIEQGSTMIGGTPDKRAPTVSEIEAQYQAVTTKPGKKDVDTYAYSNADEFWAQRTSLWFGANQYGRTPKDFCPVERNTCNLLQNTYGDPKNVNVA